MTSHRGQALDALVEILEKGAKPKDALGRLGLSGRDAAFLMDLVYGALRRRDTLQWMLKGFLRKPGSLPRRTLYNLMAGAYQIFYMRVPEWAAVNEAVEIEKKEPALVNAVLRGLIREKNRLASGLDEMKAAALDPSASEDKRLSSMSIAVSYPRWLLKRWIRRFGVEEALMLAEAGNEIPPLTLRTNLLRAGREEVLERLQKSGIRAEPTPFSPDGIRLLERRTYGELAGLEGEVCVQDEAAQIITRLLDPRPGQRVLDACAAPGGKTTHIAGLMKDEGEIVALDMDEDRIPMLRENIAAMGIASVRVVKGDVLEAGGLFKDMGLGPFDRVLLDAPCSATGVIRRNPDVKYRLRAADLARFGQRQLRMLRSAAPLLKPGGTLLYATCSVEPDEGEEVVRAFLKSSEDFFIIDDVPGVFRSEGYLRTYPHRHGMDGFFGAKIGRRGA